MYTRTTKLFYLGGGGLSHPFIPPPLDVPGCTVRQTKIDWSMDRNFQIDINKKIESMAIFPTTTKVTTNKGKIICLFQLGLGFQVGQLQPHSVKGISQNGEWARGGRPWKLQERVYQKYKIEVFLSNLIIKFGQYVLLGLVYIIAFL